MSNTNKPDTTRRNDSFALVGMLSSGLAHEINNPLSYILYNVESVIQDVVDAGLAVGNLQATINEHLGADDVRNLVGEQLRQLNSALQGDLVVRLKDALGGGRSIHEIARSLSLCGKIDDDPTNTDLTLLLDRAALLAHHEIKYRAHLSREYGSIPSVMVREGRLARVLLILLINAAYCIDEGDPEKNEIRVRTWTEHGQACIEVTALGPGLNRGCMDKLFHPSSNFDEIGVGLGLTASQEIIKDLGGLLQVQGEPDLSVVFELRLEAAIDDQMTDDPSLEESAGRRPRFPLLVVVEEDDLALNILSLLGDHNVLLASSGEEAKRILQDNQNFEIIIVDSLAPQTLGDELSAWLKQEHSHLADKLLGVEKPLDKEKFGQSVATMINKNDSSAISS